MIFFLLLLSVSSFILFFYVIWLWYIGIIPLLVFLISMIYYISGMSFKTQANSLFQNYWLFFARLIVLVWLFLILKFFGVANINWLLFLIILNILLWFSSYIFKYPDWKLMAQVWYYSTIFWLLAHLWISYWFMTFFVAFSYFWVFSLAIVGFVIFIIWIRYDIEQYLWYKFFILSLWAIGLSLYHQIENIYVFLIISVVALGILYTYIYHVLSHKPPSESQIKETSIRRILAWERVLKKTPQNTTLSKQIYAFVNNFTNVVKYFLEWINTFIILVLIYLYFKNTITLQWNIEQTFYRLVMIWFVINVFLLKRINYTSSLQRLLTFLVINFAIYISLFSALDNDIWSVVFLAIIRNILSTMMVFHIHKTRIWDYLRKIDYLFWIFTTMLALAVNIFLLFSTTIVWQLLFPIILLYVWVQVMMLYYSIKYINKIKEIVIEDSTLV